MVDEGCKRHVTPLHVKPIPRLISRGIETFETAIEMNELSDFKRRLTETVAWCAHRASVTDAANSLRTPALRPAIRPRSIFAASEHGSAAWPDFVHSQSQEKTKIAVDTLSRARARLLRRAGVILHTDAVAGTLAGGRLLLSAPDYSLYDGAPEAESFGFIDVGDAPPWDTWVWSVYEPGSAFYDAYVVSWVPEEFVALVDTGIRVSFLDTTVWATDVDTPFTRQLRAACLI